MSNTVLCTGGEAGGLEIDIKPNDTEVIVTVTEVITTNEETGEQTVSYLAKKSTDGLRYEIRGNMAVFVGTTEELS